MNRSIMFSIDSCFIITFTRWLTVSFFLDHQKRKYRKLLLATMMVLLEQKFNEGKKEDDSQTNPSSHKCIARNINNTEKKSVYDTSSIE